MYEFAALNLEQVTRSTTVLLVMLIMAYGVLLARVIPPKAHLPLNIIVAFVTVLFGLIIGLSLPEIGIAQFVRGALFGLAISAVIVCATIFVSFIPFFKKFFVAESHGTMRKSALIFEASVRIPLGTALVEEVLFRGLLLGLLLVSYSPVVALGISSLIFGLWHILPTIDSLAKNDAALKAVGNNKHRHFAGIVGVVGVTAVAGLFFGWLRLVSGSLLAPWLVHWAINSSGAISAGLQGAIARNDTFKSIKK